MCTLEVGLTGKDSVSDRWAGRSFHVISVVLGPEVDRVDVSGTSCWGYVVWGATGNVRVHLKEMCVKRDFREVSGVTHGARAWNYVSGFLWEVELK